MVGITVAVGVGVGTDAGVTIGRMLARGGGLLPGVGLGLLLGDGVLGVGRMLAVGGSDMLELRQRNDFMSLISLHYSALVHLCVFFYLPLSWAGLFKDICLCSDDLA